MAVRVKIKALYLTAVIDEKNCAPGGSCPRTDSLDFGSLEIRSMCQPGLKCSENTELRGNRKLEDRVELIKTPVYRRVPALLFFLSCCHSIISGVIIIFVHGKPCIWSLNPACSILL